MNIDVLYDLNTKAGDEEAPEGLGDYTFLLGVVFGAFQGRGCVRHALQL